MRDEQLAAGLVGQVLDGRYRLKRVLGSGGFGCVMLADHMVGDRVLSEVAVKLVPQGRTRINRQLDELEKAVQLHHPFLVRYHSAGDGRLAVGSQALSVLYVVMERAGETLASRRRRGLLGAEEVQRVGASVADALAYLASMGVVHRDVKPSNILSVDGVWKLSDLGNARELDRGVTVSRAPSDRCRICPLSRMPASCRPTGEVWSLGVTLMEAVTGQLPFLVGSVGDWMVQLQSADPRFRQRFRNLFG